jgi:uncharacterized 2Fe-2S/4Fe-4S cluster protein (DUF4445 family)
MNKTPENGPWIRAVLPEISPPSLKDNTADLDRLIKGIRKPLGNAPVHVDFSLLQKLPPVLRAHGYRIRAILYRDQGAWHLIHLQPAHEEDFYGLALDLGTSTLVLRLLDLRRNETLHETSFHNPQIQIGPDVITRLHFAGTDGGLERLQGLLIERLNQEILDLTRRHGIRPSAVAGLSAAGNTAMTHLFLGLDPHWIIREPYIPVVNRPEILPASRLGLDINPLAPILVFPNVGSYFGGDLIAGILASGMGRREEISILVDVGTNAEVVIGNRDWLMACAGAAGPALEGGVAKMGMMAGPGVIDRVEIDPETLQFTARTIQDQPPVGICGSGLIDLAAQLFLAGLIDIRGKFVPERCGDRLRELHEIRHLVVVPAEDSGTGRDLTLSQPDMDALIRSKAAMYTILTTLSDTVGIPFRQISKFYVAGTFGAYIDPRSAIVVGMIPDLPLETYVPLGNTAITGAGLALESAGAKGDIFKIQERITYLELNVNQAFMNLFSAAKFIPHTDRTLFPSVQTS